MHTEKTKIPFSILEKPVEENSFAILRFFVEFFGKENARAILNLLSDSKETGQPNYDLANITIHGLLKKKYPSLENNSDDDIQRKIIELNTKTNVVLNQLLKTSFPEMDLSLGLLNSSTIPNVNLAEVFSALMSEEESTPIYKYEIFRQIIISLMLIELEKENDILQNVRNLRSLQNIFEEKLFKNRTGEINEKELFSVHDNKTNECLNVFSSLREAEEFEQKEKTHIKKDSWKTREVDDVGAILTNMRTKSDFSIIRKAVFKAYTETKDKKEIDMGKDENLVDSTGFMFVVPNNKKEEMLNKVIYEIKINYPDVKIVPKHSVGEGRGQSSKIEFSRVLAYLDNNSKPIEIMVFDQISYMNYRFELEQAHEIFGLKKSTVSAKLFYPEDVFKYNKDEVEEKRKEKIEEIKNRLLLSNRLSTSK